MALIRVKTTQVADLRYLNILILRFIYEKEKMSKEEIALMEHSVESWHKKVDKTNDEFIVLRYLVDLLEKEFNGHFKQRKDNFKRLHISWRRFHGLEKAPAGEIMHYARQLN
jgi:hypothetical protein